MSAIGLKGALKVAERPLGAPREKLPSGVRVAFHLGLRCFLCPFGGLPTDFDTAWGECGYS